MIRRDDALAGRPSWHSLASGSACVTFAAEVQMPRNAFFPFTVLGIFWVARVVHVPTGTAFLLIGASWLNVLVHELGHAAVVLGTGGRLRAVIATPFMGMTCYDFDRRPRHEVALALAGPVGGAIFSLAALGAMRLLALPLTAETWALRLVLWAGVADNLVFNMLPLGTLDGAFLMQAIKDRRLAAAFHRQAERELEAAWQSQRGSHERGSIAVPPVRRVAIRATAATATATLPPAATARAAGLPAARSSAAHHETHAMAMRLRRVRAIRRGDAEI